jgi:hypothetical protein
VRAHLAARRAREIGVKVCFFEKASALAQLE